MNIAIVGTGYVGLVSGTCFAEMGVNVTCVDVDERKIYNLQHGQIPIYEPGLDEMVLRNQREGRLHFTTDLKTCLNDVEIVFSAVGTPPDEDGSADLKYVLEVARTVGREMNKYILLVTKSTVPVGTAKKVKATIEEELKKRKIPASIDAFIKYVKKNDIEVLQIFTDAGFNVNTDFYTDYPIYYAAKAQKYEAVKFLLEHGANPNLGFNSPLNEAINKKNPKIAHLLIEHGAKVNIDDFMSGHTLLFNAIKKEQYEIAREMIEHGAKIDAPSKMLIESKNLYDILKINKNDF